MSSVHRRRWRAPQTVQRRARQLRRDMTPAEQRLWRHLRDGHLAGHHFRRQHAVDRFIVDFFCAAKLVIEIDGDTHWDQIEYDAERTRWLNERKGYRVLRFTNLDVHDNIGAVVERIAAALKEPVG